MKLVSWNVNGLRAVYKKGFIDSVKDMNPDVLCLQEVKAMPEQLEEALPEGYQAIWNPAKKKGYSGTLVLTKPDPVSFTLGLGIDEHDQEGRVITVEYTSFFLVTVYTPNAQAELRRLDYRMQWDRAFLAYCRQLEKTKPVVFCGDLNVAHKEIDLARPKDNRKNPGFTDEERMGFDNIVAAGFIDTFREFCQEPDEYSWWSYRGGARERNVGWRIDYFCISSALRPQLKEAWIRQDIFGSDHCPVGVTMDFPTD